MKKDTPYPVVYEDHDGSWTWSIEVGEPFEPDHKVLATNQGYPDRKEAKTALELAMEGVAAKLRRDKEADLEARQARLDDAAAFPSAAPSTKAQLPAEDRVANSDSNARPQAAPTATTTSSAGHPIPSWGVFDASKLIALFATRKLARAYIDEDKALKMRKIDMTVTVN